MQTSSLNFNGILVHTPNTSFSCDLTTINIPSSNNLLEPFFLLRSWAENFSKNLEFHENKIKNTATCNHSCQRITVFLSGINKFKCWFGRGNAHWQGGANRRQFVTSQNFAVLIVDHLRFARLQRTKCVRVWQYIIGIQSLF